MDEIEETLDYYLRKKGLRRQNLAIKLHIDPSTLAKYMNGRRAWPPSLLKLACTILEIGPEDTQRLLRQLEEKRVQEIKRPPEKPTVELTEPGGPLSSEVRQEFEPEMVWIPAGRFWMGSDIHHDTMAEADEVPQHEVELPGFYMARTPITNAQYLAFLEHDGRHMKPRHWPSRREPPRGRELHPVVWVNWEDCIRYCEWLSVATGQAYRLPTEAEWEKAARGGLFLDGDVSKNEANPCPTRMFPWGDAVPDKSRCNYDVGAKGGTAPVAKYEQGNAYGLFDIAGNVWEWTSSLHWPYPYNPDDARDQLGTFGGRVVRGGSFMDMARFVRCSCRVSVGPLHADINRGFRVARSA